MPRLRYRAPKSPSRLEERFLMLWKHVKGSDLEREYRFHHERRWRADFAQMEARVLIEIEGGILRLPPFSPECSAFAFLISASNSTLQKASAQYCSIEHAIGFRR
jgi:hypothetical protein